MTTRKKPKLTESEKILTEALRAHFHYSTAVLVQVPFVSHGLDGRSHLRKADAIVLSCWSSRKEELHGFEMKSDRSGWLGDLANAQKAQDVASYCDKWSILAMPGVVKNDELPRGWGLAEVSRGILSWQVKPVEQKPLELSRDIFFGIIGAMSEQYHRVVPETALKREYNLGLATGRKEAREVFVETIRQLKEEPKSIDRFEEIGKILGTIQNADELKICEELLRLVVRRFDTKPVTSAMKTLRFLLDGDALNLSGKINDLEVSLRHVLSKIASIKHTVDGLPEEVKTEDALPG